MVAVTPFPAPIFPPSHCWCWQKCTKAVLQNLGCLSIANCVVVFDTFVFYWASLFLLFSLSQPQRFLSMRQCQCKHGAFLYLGLELCMYNIRWQYKRYELSDHIYSTKSPDVVQIKESFRNPLAMVSLEGREGKAKGKRRQRWKCTIEASSYL